jgi:uncharacterized protein YecE (DUF72 family)
LRYCRDVSKGRVRVGCSGWQYRHWRSRFYPRDLPTDRWLEFYAETFDTVELNNSFYRLPEAAQFDAWRKRLPSGFLMAVKASRYLTHNKRLLDPEEPLRRLWNRADHLGDHLGPMLYQLPSRWHRNVERLEPFVARLPARRDHAIEFRDPSWYDPAVYAVLERGGAALCLHDMPGSGSPTSPIGPFVYVRFHGATGRYAGAYSPQRLTAWAERLAAWAHAGLPGYAYFNNDAAAQAPRDALRLRELLDRRGVI